jgi:hypothetical protein
MNRQEKRITQYFQTMGMSLNQQALAEFSNREQGHLERLCERMAYLYDQMVGKKYASETKRSLFKDEFRALEWIMWEMGIVPSEARQKLDLNDPTSPDKINIVDDAIRESISGLAR